MRVEEEPDAEVLHGGGHFKKMGGIIMKRIKTLEYASAGAFIAGFFACSTDSIAIAAAAAALMGLGAWGFNRAERLRKKEAGR